MRVTYVIKQMDATGLEPVTFGLQSRYSPTELSARELPVSPGCQARLKDRQLRRRRLPTSHYSA